MVKIYLNSYRVRLPKFRIKYKILFIVLFGSLVFFDVMLFLNKYTPARSLSESFYFIKPLSETLKKSKINEIECGSDRLCEGLYFYGIKKGKKYKLYYSKKKKKVSIFHKKKKVFELNVSKLNTL